jgi:hypothetical protein
VHDHWDRVSDGNIDRITRDGQLVCSIWKGQTSGAGLAWGAGTLWLAEHGNPAGKIFAIDPAVACPAGRWVVVETLTAPAERMFGLTWDGTHVLVAGDFLYRVTTRGGVVEEYDLPVRSHSYGDIAWDGDGVWISNTGPKELTSNDYVISRFKLR